MVTRTRVGVVVALVVSTTALPARAANKFPATWQFYQGTYCGTYGTNEGDVSGKGFATCMDAAKAAEAAFLACYPAGQVQLAYVCDTPTFSEGNVVTLSKFGGGWNWSGTVAVRCGTKFAAYDAVLGMVCTDDNYALGSNLGASKECADCQRASPTVGNPLTPSIANKFQTEVDYVGAGPFPLRLVRYHNSLSEDSRAGFALNWSHSYAQRLLVNANKALVSAMRADGKRISFALVGAVYVADPVWNERLTKTATGFTLVTEDDEVETYDNNGRLLAIANRYGLTQSLTYNAAGALTAVTDPMGRTMTFTRDLWQRIATMSVGGTSFAYAYSLDGRGNLIKVTYPDTKTRLYHYELSATFPSRLTGITDENNVRVATFSYDAAGLATRTTHVGNADRVTMVPDTTPSGTRNVTVTKSIDAAKNLVATYVYQSIQGVAFNTGITFVPATGGPCPECGLPSRTFDTKGNLTASVDWNGNRTNRVYNAKNQQTSWTEGLTAAGAATALSRTFSMEWHATLRVPTRVAGPRQRTTLVYNGDGGVTCGMLGDGVTPVPGVVCTITQVETTDATGSTGFAATVSGAPRTTSFTYDANGQVLSSDGPRTDATDVAALTYYADGVTCPGSAPLGCRGQLAATTDALGHLTQFAEYDAHGSPLKIIDPNGAIVTFTYDARRRVKSRSLNGLVTSYAYDGVGQVTRITLPDGAFMDFAYDSAQRLVEMADNGGNRVVYTLDYVGHRVKEEVFDASNALTRTRRRVYSNLNRLTQEIGGQNDTTSFAYDGEGNLTSVVDPLGRVTTRAFDALHRLIKTTDAMAPTPGITTVAYDAQDNPVGVTNARNLTTTTTFDGFGDAIQIASPESGPAVATYDAAGNLLTRIDAKNQKTEFQYDAMNRPVLVKYADATQAVYAYDDAATNAIGRLSSVTDKSGTRSYAYDALGRLLSETLAASGAVPLTVAYQYDAVGHLAKMSYPSGRTLTYAYDPLGRVGQVQTSLSGTSTMVADLVKYRPFGAMASFKTQGGAVLARTFDLDGRLASFMTGGTTWNVTYDAASQITSLGDAAALLDPKTYGYDALGRLVSATTPAGAATYGYDAVGNRTTSGAQTLSYSATSNQLMSTSAPDPRGYAYDGNGSPTSDGTRAYEYDARGRMVKATIGSVTADYLVGSNGARVAKTVTR